VVAIVKERLIAVPDEQPFVSCVDGSTVDVDPQALSNDESTKI
jgi:hypothetical protein